MARDASVRDFERRMAKVPALIRRKVNAAIEVNAAEWVRASRSAAPQDPDDGTPLHDSIRHYPTETGGQIVRAGGPTTTKLSAAGPSDYAVHQEFGTSEQPPNPFFWPIYRLLKKRMASRRSRAMSAAIKEFNNGK